MKLWNIRMKKSIFSTEQSKGMLKISQTLTSTTMGISKNHSRELGDLNKEPIIGQMCVIQKLK